MSMQQLLNTTQAVDFLKQQKVIAYPTEAVTGLGCDPLSETAVRQLLAIKKRPEHKGLILIAASYKQLLPFIDYQSLPAARWQTILARWPGPVTWVIPAHRSAPKWLTGQFDTIAVRVTDHPTVIDLCQKFGGAIVSTSANLTGEVPTRSDVEAQTQLGHDIAGVVQGSVGCRLTPSVIIDAQTEEIIRA